jgi:hypothetical protein
MILFAAGETWFAVFGGLIPILGLGLILWILWRAVQPPEGQKKSPEDEEPPEV